MDILTEDLVSFGWSGGPDGWELLDEDDGSHGRWSYWTTYVVRAPDGKLYRGEVEMPATEYQEVYRPERTELEEVEAREKVTIEYVPKGAA